MAAETLNYVLNDPCTSKTLQKTEARFISNFGWGLTKQLESHSLARFKANIQRVRFPLLRQPSHPLIYICIVS